MGTSPHSRLWREPAAVPQTDAERLMQPGDTFDIERAHLDAVVAIIEDLPDDERELIESYFFERASYREIARRQDTNQVNTWRQVQRLLKKLNVAFTEDPTIARRYHLEQPNDMEPSGEPNPLAA